MPLNVFIFFPINTFKRNYSLYEISTFFCLYFHPRILLNAQSLSCIKEHIFKFSFASESIILVKGSIKLTVACDNETIVKDSLFHCSLP